MIKRSNSALGSKPRPHDSTTRNRLPLPEYIEHVHVGIDEAGRDEEATRVDDLFAGAGCQAFAQRREAAIGERDVACGVQVLRGVEDRAGPGSASARRGC